MAAHQDSTKREANVRVKKMPTRLHRKVTQHKERHHHDSIWAACLDLIERGLIVEEKLTEMMITMSYKELQPATPEEGRLQ